MNLRIASLCLAILLPCASPSVAVDTVRVGDVPIRIAAPEGFRRLDGRAREFDTRLRAMPPKANRVAAFYGSPGDLAEVLATGRPGLDRSCSVQVPRSFEAESLSQTDFRALGHYLDSSFAELRSRYRTITDALKSQSADDVFGETFSLAPGELIPLGMDAHTDSTIAFTVLSRTHWPEDTASATEPGLSVSAASAVLVEGKLVYLYATSVYRDKADAAWARAEVAEWRKQIIELNPPGTDTPDN